MEDQELNTNLSEEIETTESTPVKESTEPISDVKPAVDEKLDSKPVEQEKTDSKPIEDSDSKQQVELSPDDKEPVENISKAEPIEPIQVSPAQKEPEESELSKASKDKDTKTEKLVSMYLNDKIKLKDIEKAKLKKDSVLALKESLLVSFIAKGLPSNISISQEELLHLYGRTISGKGIIDLAKQGAISSEKAILITNKHSLPITDPTLAVDPVQMLEFYSAKVLESMHTNGSLTGEFVTNYNENLVSTLSDEEKDNLYRQLISDTVTVVNKKELSKEDTTQDQDEKDTDKKSKTDKHKETPEIDEEPEENNSSLNFSPVKKSYYEDLIFSYYMLGILPASYTGSTLDFNYIKNKFESQKISYATLLDLFINNIITAKQFLQILDTRQVDTKELFSGDVLSKEELTILSSDKKADIFNESMKLEKLTLDDLMHLYLSESAIRVSDLREALLRGQITDNISSYLDENTPKIKIEELYTNYLIDYNSLISLKRDSVISEEEFDELKNKINPDDFYKQLAETSDLYIHTTPDNISSSIRHFYKAGYSERADFKHEQKMLTELYGVPEKQEELTMLHATDLDGNPTSLDGYSLLPMPRFRVVTLKKFRTDSDTFIMPYQQAAYFLHNSYEPETISDSGQPELDVTQAPTEQEQAQEEALTNKLKSKSVLPQFESGYNAEIPLPLEDYNDSDAITVVQYGLNYRRQLLDAIYELSDNETEKAKLKVNSMPTKLAEKHISVNPRPIDQIRDYDDSI